MLQSYSGEELSDELYSRVWTLLRDSFPVTELPSSAEIRAGVETGERTLWMSGRLTVMALTQSLQTPAGDTLLEYLASAPADRSHGHGSVFVQQLVQVLHGPVVFEMEEPLRDVDPQTVRREAFYRRLGAVRIPFSRGYAMPNLSGPGCIPMWLMDLTPDMRPTQWTQSNVRNLVVEIWRASYGVADLRDARLKSVLRTLR